MTRKCTWCGLEVNDDILFCPSDGKRTAHSSTEDTAGVRRRSIYVFAPGAFKTGQVLGVVGAVLLGVLGAVIWLGYAVSGEPVFEGSHNLVLGILSVVSAVGSFFGAIGARHRWWAPLGLLGLSLVTSVAWIPFWPAGFLFYISSGLFGIALLCIVFSRERSR